MVLFDQLPVRGIVLRQQISEKSKDLRFYGQLLPTQLRHSALCSSPAFMAILPRLLSARFRSCNKNAIASEEEEDLASSDFLTSFFSKSPRIRGVQSKLQGEVNILMLTFFHFEHSSL